MRYYRFKTREEFIAEYGVNWNDIVVWNRHGNMDYLFGTDICIPNFIIRKDDTFYYNYPDVTNINMGGYWMIDEKMVIEKKIPSYKPKKFIREI